MFFWYLLARTKIKLNLRSKTLFEPTFAAEIFACSKLQKIIFFFPHINGNELELSMTPSSSAAMRVLQGFYVKISLVVPLCIFRFVLAISKISVSKPTRSTPKTLSQLSLKPK